MRPIRILITLALLLSVSMIPAQQSFSSNSDMAMTNNANSQITKELNKYLHYPIQPVFNHDGSCMITFKITDGGTVEILSIGTQERDIANYVKNQMQKVQVPTDDPAIGKVFTYRLTFAKEA